MISGERIKVVCHSRWCAVFTLFRLEGRLMWKEKIKVRSVCDYQQEVKKKTVSWNTYPEVWGAWASMGPPLWHHCRENKPVSQLIRGELVPGCVSCDLMLHNKGHSPGSEAAQQAASRQEGQRQRLFWRISFTFWNLKTLDRAHTLTLLPPPWG